MWTGLPWLAWIGQGKECYRWEVPGLDLLKASLPLLKWIRHDGTGEWLCLGRQGKTEVAQGRVVVPTLMLWTGGLATIAVLVPASIGQRRWSTGEPFRTSACRQVGWHRLGMVVKGQCFCLCIGQYLTFIGQENRQHWGSVSAAVVGTDLLTRNAGRVVTQGEYFCFGQIGVVDR